MQVGTTMRIGTTATNEGDVSVVGPTHLSSVDCESFSAAGATKVDGDVKADVVSLKGRTNVAGDLEAEEVTAKGSSNVAGDLKAEEFTVKGSTNVAGSVNADETTVKGSTRIEGDLRTGRLDAKGSSNLRDVSADSVSAAGALSVADLVADAVEIQGVVDANRIRAEEIRIALGDDDSSVGTIQGKTVVVEREKMGGPGETDGHLDAETVTGDEVAIEHATVEEVSGETVRLGPGAKVGVVRAGELDVDENATVERTEEFD